MQPPVEDEFLIFHVPERLSLRKFNDINGTDLKKFDKKIYS